MRLLLRVAHRLRSILPETMPLFVRISATDWVDGGWDIDQSVVLAGFLRDLGVDLIDVSSGASCRTRRSRSGQGYQVPFARQNPRRGRDHDRGRRHDHRARQARASSTAATPTWSSWAASCSASRTGSSRHSSRLGESPSGRSSTATRSSGGEARLGEAPAGPAIRLEPRQRGESIMALNIRLDGDVAILSNFATADERPQIRRCRPRRPASCSIRECATSSSSWPESRRPATSFLGVLMTITREIRRAGGEAVLAHPSRDVEKHLAMMQMDDYWDVFGTVDEAKEFFQRNESPHEAR